ncbi:hypothetical protein [Paenibacillus abyssi]|uniref:Uncharacterized protein n=1 Tax=Paenibacillus abyssi TaxID=1340531 RepID=A0A917G1J7_9BACL|nr:hypothetical protein [Paenibacillus abyssi]GGG18240.1 hypothetical protein GCM10010916_38830 [Paenibacillus abyssi]
MHRYEELTPEQRREYGFVKVNELTAARLKSKKKGKYKPEKLFNSNNHQVLELKPLDQSD